MKQKLYKKAKEKGFNERTFSRKDYTSGMNKK